MNIPIGWLIALATAFGGFYWLGGEFKQLWVPEES
jgi:flagellar motor component MotA